MFSHTFPSFSSHLSLFSLGPFPSQFSCLNLSFCHFFSYHFLIFSPSFLSSLSLYHLLSLVYCVPFLSPPWSYLLFSLIYILIRCFLSSSCLLFILCLLYPSVSVFFYLHTLITLSSSFPKSASASVGIGLFIYSMSLMPQRYSNPLLSPQTV